MSWSVQAIGKPEAVKAQLQRACEAYQEGSPSRREFDEALPHLLAIVDGNIGPVAVHVEANGHASIDSAGLKTCGALNVKVQQYYGFVE
jgi:hypothetical protein